MGMWGNSSLFDELIKWVLWVSFFLTLCFCLSVSQPFKGDYLEISKNPKYQKLNSAVEEKVLLADVVNKINRANGKVRKIAHIAIFTLHLVCLTAEKSKNISCDYIVTCCSESCSTFPHKPHWAQKSCFDVYFTQLCNSLMFFWHLNNWHYFCFSR